LTFVAASTCNVVSLAWFKLAVSLPAITAAVAASSQPLSLKMIFLPDTNRQFGRED
jgi:hypothetical protein